MIGFTLALMAGVCAATASVFAKLAMTPALWSLWICDSFLADWSNHHDRTCYMVVIAARVFSFSFVLLCNALMWTLFVKSLQKCGSSAEATVTNSASNFVSTAVFSHVIFGERSTLQWWLGISLVLSGLILIHFSYEEDFKLKEEKVD